MTAASRAGHINFDDIIQECLDYAHQYHIPLSQAIEDWEGDGPSGSWGLTKVEEALLKTEMERRGFDLTVKRNPTTAHRLAAEIDEAQTKAIDALSRYKFQMFGYWAGIWVHLNRIEGKRRPSPFKHLVLAARGLAEPTPDDDEFDLALQEFDQEQLT